MSRKKLSNFKRGAVFARDNFTCVYCGKKADRVSVRRAKRGSDIVTPEVDDQVFGMEVDHKVPVCLGGSNEVSNLVTACWSCNSKKSSMSYQSFLQQQYVTK